MISLHLLGKIHAMRAVKMNNQFRSPNRKRHQVLRIKKLTGRYIIKNAAKHNLREILAEIRAGSKIDPTKTHLNQILVGAHTSFGVEEEYEQMIEAAKLRTKIRKDAVRGIEVVISLPSDHDIDELLFFTECAEWCTRYFGIPVLGAVIHRDEPNPHSHTILVPLVGGRLQGSRLVGNRIKWRAMQENFYESIGIRYGFTRPRPLVKYAHEFRRDVATQIICCIKANVGYLYDDRVEQELIEVVSSDPLDLARMVGIGI